MRPINGLVSFQFGITKQHRKRLAPDQYVPLLFGVDTGGEVHAEIAGVTEFSQFHKVAEVGVFSYVNPQVGSSVGFEVGKYQRSSSRFFIHRHRATRRVYVRDECTLHDELAPRCVGTGSGHGYYGHGYH